MSKLFSIPMIALSLLIGACSVTTTGQLTDAEFDQLTPAQHVYAARLDYNRMLKQFVNYAGQPACTNVVIVACSETIVVRKAFDAFLVVDETLDNAELMVAGTLAGDPLALVGNSRRSLATLSAYLIAKEVVK